MRDAKLNFCLVLNLGPVRQGQKKLLWMQRFVTWNGGRGFGGGVGGWSLQWTASTIDLLQRELPSFTGCLGGVMWHPHVSWYQVGDIWATCPCDVTNESKNICPNLTLLLYVVWWHNEPHSFLEQPNVCHTHFAGAIAKRSTIFSQALANTVRLKSLPALSVHPSSSGLF